MACALHDRVAVVVRILRPWLVLPLLIAVVTFAALMAVLGTERGSLWLLDRAAGAAGYSLTYAAADGSLVKGLALTALVIDGEVNVTARDARFSVQPRFFSPGLRLSNVHVSELVVTLPVAGPAADGEQRRALPDPQSLALPLVIDIAAAEVDGLRIDRRESDSAVASLLGLETITLAARWGSDIDIEELVVAATAYDASLSGRLDLAAPNAVELRLEAGIEPALSGRDEPLGFVAELAGSLREARLSVTEQSLSLAVDGSLTGLLSTPRWDLLATLPHLAAGDLSLSGIEVRTAGKTEAFEVEVQTALTTAALDEDVALAARATGSMQRVVLDSLRLTHPGFVIDASGTLNAAGEFKGTVDLPRLAPVALTRAWPAGSEYTGTLALTASTDGVTISDALLRDTGSAAAVGFEGRHAFDSGSFDATLSWQSLAWPPTGAEAQVESREGSASIRGTSEAWTLTAGLLLSAPDVVEGRLGLSANGTRSGAEFLIDEGSVLGGRIAGAGSVAWADTPGYEAELMLEDLRTAALYPALPGTLSASISAQSADGPGSVAVTVDRLEGTILGKTLAGGGTFELASLAFRADALELRHGGSELRLDGELYATRGLDFRLHSRSLGDYAADIAGDVVASGNVSLAGRLPRVTGEASSERLSFRGAAAEGIAIDARPVADDATSIVATLARISAGNRVIEDIAVEAGIAERRQALSLRFAPLGHRVAIDLWGGPVADSSWEGQLDNVEFVAVDGSTVRLDEPVRIAAADGGIVMEPFCLRGDAAGSLCGEARYDRRRQQLALEADNVRMEDINLFYPTGLGFTQAVSGTLAVDREADRRPSARAVLTFSPGRVISKRFYSLDFETGEGELAFDMVDGRILASRLSLPLAAGGFLNGEFRVADVLNPASSPITGRLEARVDDIDVFAAFLPDIERAEGSLSADLVLEGRMDAPVLTGKAALLNGALDYFPLGLAVRDINLDGEFDEQGRLSAQGRFRAGDGVASIRTEAREGRDMSKGVHLSIRGEDLALINLPEISAAANLDLALDYADRRLDLNGSVAIPVARITPVSLPPVPVVESEDVVIISGELPMADPDGGQPQSRLAFHGNVSLGIGNDVELRLDVARAKLAGEADFEWTGEPIPTGRGRYSIDGTVQALGQVLTISEGSIRFPGVPANDPLLDIRATRDIFGNSEVKRAGVRIEGALSKPVVKAYTYPETTEERALTLLVTGNDFNLENGVGAIDFGTYIAPRVFVSYGIGVFDRQNIFSVRYDLKRGFGVRATSSLTESGVDLTYSLER